MAPSDAKSSSRVKRFLRTRFVACIRRGGLDTATDDWLPAHTQYAVQSHLDLHGLGSECLIEVLPRENEVNVRTEDILRTIDEQGDEVHLP